MTSQIIQSPPPTDIYITLFDAEVETSSIYPESEAEGRPKKRSKTSARASNDSKAKKPRKTRGGKLRDLPEMPLDILLEIFGHLLPRDVLHLSRATKSLRNILMRRSAVSVWKDASSNLRIKPPPCPSDMTEPQWASFLFDPYCQFCLASGVQTSMWLLKVRACKSCIQVEKNFMRTEHFSEAFDKLYSSVTDRGGSLLDLLPFHLESGEGGNIYITPDVFQDFMKRYLKAANKRTFLKEQKKLMTGLKKFYRLCHCWQMDMKQERSDELEDLRSRRKAAIFERLGGLGWATEIEKLNKWNPAILSLHPSIKQPKALTDRIWANIQLDLVQFLKTQKVERLKHKRENLVGERRELFISVMEGLAQRHHSEIIPPLADIHETDWFKLLLNAPFEKDITAGYLDHLIELRLPKMTEEWRRAKDIQLLSLIPIAKKNIKASSSSAQDVSKLSLATTFFYCNVCRTAISYPRILVHKCISEFSAHTSLDIDDERFFVFMALGSEPWNPDNKIRFHRSAHTIARKVVKTCGMDPNTATTSDMNDSDYWLEGVAHQSESHESSRSVMRWSTAVSRKWASQHLSVVTDADTLVAAKQEEVIRDKVCCAQCGSALLVSRMKTHLKIHGLILKDDQIKEGRHYYTPIDSPPPEAVKLPMHN